MGDRMFLRGNYADYTITYDSVTHEYTLVDQAPGRDGTDVVKGVKLFNFADGARRNSANCCHMRATASPSPAPRTTTLSLAATGWTACPACRATTSSTARTAMTRSTAATATTR